LSQAQILGDTLYQPDKVDAQPWVVYYISRPLVGFPELLKYTVPKESKLQNGTAASGSGSSSKSAPGSKKEVKSFSELMDKFPMIARQMQPGLERIFNEFRREVEKPLPALPAPGPTTRKAQKRRSSISSMTSLGESVHSTLTNGVAAAIYHSSLELTQAEEDLRHSLEIAITAAIDLFQMVDKQQLSLLGSSTDLTGAMVERMIERYVTEQLHDNLLFPRICASRKSEDVELEARVRQMTDIDISQVGLSIETGRAGKKELALRLSKGVAIFKKMGVAGSPQEMLEILLETEKSITRQEPSDLLVNGEASPSEKQPAILTINADTLVSLLLVVVIRSPVRHLQARLSYMRHFIFIDDLESGEIGYAVSTFEAVLSYLSHDSNRLRRSSLRNRRLWQATKSGNIAEMRQILEPDAVTTNGYSPVDVDVDGEGSFNFNAPLLSSDDIKSLGGSTVNEDAVDIYDTTTATDGSLDHVFPFQKSSPSPSDVEIRPKTKKKVFVQSRSTSISSQFSIRSLPLTLDSLPGGGFEGDVSMETLSQTQGPNGESVLMMAVHSQQEKALKYLLNLRAYFPIHIVLDDENTAGTTLLSAAIQTGNHQIADMILDFVTDNAESDDAVRVYMTRQDENGRCAAHFLFDYPGLMTRIGHLIPWQLKANNGQTPLFALCRSYDHEDYKWMVDTAMAAATKAQRDGKRLRLADHVDNRGNTLLHIVNEASLASKLLTECESDVNAANDKQFTPLMVASKYGRTEMVRTLFSDARVDLYARDFRGLTATELAKDEEVRNRIDDLILLSSPPTFSHRVTSVVRSYFVEDGTVRFIIKSAAKNPNSSVTITTCRRSLSDFDDLAKWLALEHPASWLPHPSSFPPAFLLPSRPSRSIARDMQLRLDAFLNVLLAHPTFATHEMVWEFFLVPDMAPAVLADRAARKAAIRAEAVRDEYAPISDVREVELFVAHARESVRGLSASTASVLRRVNNLGIASADLHDAASLAANAWGALHLKGMPETHSSALTAYAHCLRGPEFSPAHSLFYDLSAIHSTTTALLAALSRPATQISSISAASKTLERARSAHRRAQERVWPRPLGLQLLDDARARATAEAAEKMEASRGEVADLGKELRYSQQVVAGEMAGWQEERVRMGRRALREYARRMVTVERQRLEGIVRAARLVGAVVVGNT
jgi:hypothetical protein